MRLLSVRDFKQIAGRAGRKGFDERGSVVCQAPEHVTRQQGRGGARGARRQAPAEEDAAARLRVAGRASSFEQLVAKPPETLVSSFAVSHGMILALLQREPGARSGAAAATARSAS